MNLGISGDDVVHGNKFQNVCQSFYILPPVYYALATLDGNVSKMTFRPKQAEIAKISECRLHPGKTRGRWEGERPRGLAHRPSSAVRGTGVRVWAAVPHPGPSCRSF